MSRRVGCAVVVSGLLLSLTQPADAQTNLPPFANYNPGGGLAVRATASPEAGANWRFRFAATFMFPR